MSKKSIRQKLIKKFEDELNHQELLSNAMTNRFDLLLTFVKLEMKGTEDQKIKQLNKRITSFFDFGGSNFDISKDHFSPRKQSIYSSPSTLPLKNQLILFGVDFLTPQKIKNLFGELETKIRWIDHSNCKLIFANGQETKQALNMIVDFSIEGNIQYQMDNIPRRWFKCLSYTEMTFQRILECRFATTDELVVQAKPTPNYEAYKRARKQFQKDIYNSFREPLKRYQEFLEDDCGLTKKGSEAHIQRERSRNKCLQNKSNSVRSHHKLEKNYMKDKVSHGQDRSIEREPSVVSEGSMISRFNKLDLSYSREFKNDESSIMNLSFDKQSRYREMPTLNSSFNYSKYVNDLEEKQNQRNQRKRSMSRSKNLDKLGSRVVIDIDD